jgi:hypothetical protein
MMKLSRLGIFTFGRVCAFIISFTPINERFRAGEVFRHVFERVVEACIAAGLVGGEGFAVDASLIAADANKQRSIAGRDFDLRRLL